MSVQRTDRGLATPLTRRAAVAMGLTLANGMLAATSAQPAFAATLRQATPVASTPGDQAEAIVAIAREIMEQARCQGGDSERDHRWAGDRDRGAGRVDDGRAGNDGDALSQRRRRLRLRRHAAAAAGGPAGGHPRRSLATWLPDLRDADKVTLRMLANMTAGYPDFVQNPKLSQEVYADPFRQWTPEEQIAIGLSTPRLFAPGTNWDYSHTDYVILGQALEKITGQPLDVALQEQVLGPMGLRNTVAWSTPEISEPVLHAFSSERRQQLGIPAGTRFYEESTYWNPSWTLAKGAIQTTDIVDMITTAAAVGEGTLLSPASHQAQIAPDLLGFGKPLAGCPACHTLDETYTYGLGVVLSNDWILQNPLFAGYGAVTGYLPAEKIAIAVATTYGEGAFDDQGNYKYSSHQEIFGAIGTHLAPDHPLPKPSNRQA